MEAQEQQAIQERNLAALRKRFAAKQTVAERTLVGVYGALAVRVLSRMEVIASYQGREVPAMVKTRAGVRKGTKRTPTMFGPTKKALPTLDEYRKFRDQIYSVSLKEFISGIYGEWQSLAEEAREIVENAQGTNLEQTNRIQTFDETANTMESIDEPDLPEWLDAITIVNLPSPWNERHTGRGSRCSQACDEAQEAMDKLDEIIADPKAFEKEAGREISEDDVSELEELKTELDNDKSEAENAEWPGMFG